MTKFLTVVLISLLVSCSSTQEAEARAQWKTVDYPNEKKRWRPCSEQLDGPEYHRKGWCYKIKECRKRFLRRKECRPKLQFCAWGDLACYDKYGFFDKKLH